MTKRWAAPDPAARPAAFPLLGQAGWANALTSLAGLAGLAGVAALPCCSAGMCAADTTVAAALLAPHVGGAAVSSCAKGLDPADGRRASVKLGCQLGPDVPVLVLSGPNFAAELARGQPTFSVLAGADPALTGRLAAALDGPAWAIEASTDVLGVELGGALKNVMALASGMAEGLGLGDNARAAIDTFALGEETRLAVALGARLETVLGLAGVGDFIATGRGGPSRNRRAGVDLARGVSVEHLLSAAPRPVEGLPTALGARYLARAAGVEVPVIEAVCRVVAEKMSAAEAIAAVLGGARRPATRPAPRRAPFRS